MDGYALHIQAAYAESDRFSERYLTVLGWCLLGYALMSRGFAYLGVPPIFIGEIMLGVGVIAMLRSGGLAVALRSPALKLVAGFMAWGALCTLPHIAQYGVESLRDAVTWGYALFAFIVASLIIARPYRLRTLLLRYQHFAAIFIGLIWFLYIFYKVAGEYIPDVFNGMPLFMVKPGDILAHLAGATAFILVGMRRLNPVLGICLALGLAFTIIGNRGGMIAWGLATALVVVFKPPTVKVTKVAYGFAVLVTILALVDPSVQIDRRRTISFDQLWANIESIYSKSEASDGTKEWRLLWWTKIVNYTFGGEYFWMGKGYGINLADSDGFQVGEDPPLRSPHNGTMTILARSGVPGLLLWVFVHGVWLFQLMSRCLQARRLGDHAWSAIFLFLVAYWIGFFINASFDVFFEGPMGGIWFWTLYGFGVAAVHVYHHHPEIARD